MTIKVNPKDKTHAENYRPELFQYFDTIKNIQIESSPGVERGGCVIETNFGTIDAQWSSIDKEIEKIMHLAPTVNPQDLPTSEPPEAESGAGGDPEPPPAEKNEA